jgi:hypothetical protein
MLFDVFRLMNRFCTMAIVAIAIGGCSAPFVQVVPVDQKDAARVEQQVKIYQRDALRQLKYTSLGQIDAISCQSRPWDPGASEDNATDQLRIKAQSLGANGLAHPKCEKSVWRDVVARNCWASVQCYAPALKVSQ